VEAHRVVRRRGSHIFQIICSHMAVKSVLRAVRPLSPGRIKKVKLSLSLIKHYAMKAYGGVDVYIHIFLTSALAGGEWSASRPCRFTLGERAPGTHWIGGWVDPRAGQDDWRRENSWSYRDSNSDPSIVQSVASRYTDCAIPALTSLGKNN
jgi:hypothetical protein